MKLFSVVGQEAVVGPRYRGSSLSSAHRLLTTSSSHAPINLVPAAAIEL